MLSMGLLSLDSERVEQTTEMLAFIMNELNTTINTLVTSYGWGERPSLPKGAKKAH